MKYTCIVLMYVLFIVFIRSIDRDYRISGYVYVYLVRYSVNKCLRVLIHWTASILQCIIKLAPQCLTLFYFFMRSQRQLLYM